MLHALLFLDRPLAAAETTNLEAPQALADLVQNSTWPGSVTQISWCVKAMPT